MASAQQSKTPTSHTGHTQSGIGPADQYTIGWICALPIELAAAVKMLDEEHPRLLPHPGDVNSYRFGRIGDHNIVIGCLPSGRTGLVSATSVVVQMMSAFRQIRVGLMVGIGGGVPSEDDDIRLGDVVVSHPNGQHGGVVQYDFGKIHPNGFIERTGSLNSPPNALLTALTDVRATEEMDELKIVDYLSRCTGRLPTYAYPSKLTDCLYHPRYLHVGGKSCSQCDSEQCMDRDQRSTNTPRIHYGTIASGDRVIKDAFERDKISQDLGGVLCFEMEAAGLMNNFPCLVIRGVSDYSDSHKNDGWHRYAAATAAAFAKELLGHLAPTGINQIDPISHAMNQMATQLSENSELVERTNHKVGRATEREILEWLSPSLKLSNVQSVTRDCRVHETGDWFIRDLRYLTWFQTGGLIWLHGVAGCGKTVLSSKIIDDLKERCMPVANARVAYWYFQFSDSSTQDISHMLRSILRQLISFPLPDRVHRLWSQHFLCHTEPSRTELLDAISALVKAHAAVHLVLDALDEYPADKSPGRSTLLETIAELMTSCAPSLRCLVTSRREPDIRKLLESVASCVIDINPAIKCDVAKFVDFSLRQDSIQRWGDLMVSLAATKLLDAEERRFRWTDLQIKRLRKCPTEDDFQTALDTIPESLEETYHQALATIPIAHQKRVRKILIWLTSSFREMTSREIAAVVSFPFVEDVLRICTSVLVTVIDGDTHETIKLAHFTVKEFLIIQQAYDQGIHWYRFTAQLAHCCITEQVIHWMSSSPALLPKNLHLYAGEYWLAHARQNDITTDWADVQLLVDSVLAKDDNTVFQDWLRVHHSSEISARSPLSYASLLGLKASVVNFWHKSFPYDNENEILGDVITTAARMGHFEIVRWLVEQRTDACAYIDLPRIVESLQVNIRQTLYELLRRGPKIEFTAEATFAATQNVFGEAIMEVLLDQDLVSVTLTEDIVDAAANNHWNRKILDALVQRRVRQFPVSLRALLAIAKTSLYALNTLVTNRKDEIHFQEHDYSILAQEKSVFTVQKLLSQGVTIHVTLPLLKAIAGSPYGSEMLNLLLTQQDSPRLFIKEEVHAMAECFSLKTFRSLISLDWEENIVTKDLFESLARNRYLEPPKKVMPSRVNPSAVHRDFRSTLGRSDRSLRSSILKSLVAKAGQDIQITEPLIDLVADKFNTEALVCILDKLIGRPLFALSVNNAMLHSPDQFMYRIRARAYQCRMPNLVNFLKWFWEVEDSQSDLPSPAEISTGGSNRTAGCPDAVNASGQDHLILSIGEVLKRDPSGEAASDLFRACTFCDKQMVKRDHSFYCSENCFKKDQDNVTRWLLRENTKPCFPDSTNSMETLELDPLPALLRHHKYSSADYDSSCTVYFASKAAPPERNVFNDVEDVYDSGSDLHWIVAPDELFATSSESGSSEADAESTTCTKCASHQGTI